MAKTKPQKPVEPDAVLDTIPEVPQLVKEETNMIRSFFMGSVSFFAKATELERAAEGLRSQAQMMKRKFETTPVTREDDEQLQVDIRKARMTRNEIDQFWGITGVVSRFHKRLVAGRERAGAMADEAAELLQPLHNNYVREEQRKAREEEERRRQEATEKARRETEIVAAALDAEALRQEAASAELSEREQRFVDLVFQGFNTPATAARYVGYKNPEQQGARLMDSAKIQAALSAKRAAVAAREQAQAVREKPLNVAIDKVRPNVTKVAGTRDVKRWKATVYDADAFLAAVLDPKTRVTLGIPTDTVTFVQPKLNELARALHEKMNLWPGVRAEEDTSTS